VLTSNRWQGNVRELENTMHRSVLMAQGDEIGVEAILTPDGDRLDLAKTVPAVAHATFAPNRSPARWSGARSRTSSAISFWKR